MSNSICDDCLYENLECNEKPCSTCLHWIDGYLEALNYESVYIFELKNKK